jgi:uncharacterized protein
MAVASIVGLRVGQLALNPSPIYANWVLEGNPVARNKILSSSADGSASTIIWDCTAGRFNWTYDVDETIYVIEGGVVVKDIGGATRRLIAGDTIFFPAGARAEWHVESYIRKIAFCRTPLPRSFVFARRGYGFLKRLMGGGARENAAAAMFNK